MCSSDLPEGVRNIYRAWHQVSRPLTKAEKKDLQATSPAITSEELDNRRVETDQWAWSDWIINKALGVAKAGATKARNNTRKLAITIAKREGMTLMPVGNFRTSKEACEYLGLATGKDSARRVLEAHHYIVDSYDGNDYLVKTTM